MDPWKKWRKGRKCIWNVVLEKNVNIQAPCVYLHALFGTRNSQLFPYTALAKKLKCIICTYATGITERNKWQVPVRCDYQKIEEDKYCIWSLYTGRFITFSAITNVYKKETKGPTLMELFTVTEKLKKFFWQLEMLNVCITGDTAHIDTIFKFLPHTRQHECIDILHCCNDPCLRGHVAMMGRTSAFHHCHVTSRTCTLFS
jgi:hypothetical protein